MPVMFFWKSWFTLSMLLVLAMDCVQAAPVPNGVLSTTIERLDQEALPYTPKIPVITGPFYVEIEVQCDDLLETGWQRLFDFSTGTSSTSIHLTTYSSSTGGVGFQYFDDNGGGHWVSFDGAMTKWSTDTWRVGVDADGLMTLHKNGVLLDSKPNVPPPTGAVLRTQQNIGRSNPTGSNGFDGVITNIKVQNLNDSKLPLYRSLANLPGQVLNGKFTASMYVRIDETGTRSNQPIFDFRNSFGVNVIRFRQSGSGTSLMLEVIQGGFSSVCTTDVGAFVKGQMAFWVIRVDGSTWTLQRNGSTVKTCPDMFVPVSEFRRNMQFGDAPSYSLLKGVVLRFRLDQTTSELTAQPPDEISPPDVNDPIV